MTTEEKLALAIFRCPLCFNSKFATHMGDTKHHSRPICRECEKLDKAEYDQLASTGFKKSERQIQVEKLAEPGRLPPELSTTPSFTIKDSGERQQFSSGMVRDTTEGKIDYLLVRDGPMYQRWAVQLTGGAVKYDERNWMKAEGERELARARKSATRHFEQWLNGETDEDHAAAVFFNINLAEYVKDKMARSR